MGQRVLGPGLAGIASRGVGIGAGIGADTVARCPARAGLRRRGAAVNPAIVYVANADSQDISVLALDRRDGSIQWCQTFAVGGNVMPMALSPDRRLLDAALRDATRPPVERNPNWGCIAAPL